MIKSGSRLKTGISGLHFRLIRKKRFCVYRDADVVRKEKLCYSVNEVINEI